MMIGSQQNDTIFAPSTAIGGAIAVIRVSGSEVKTIGYTLTGKKLLPNRMTYCEIRIDQEVLDASMVVYFAAPHSYTGEDMLELHCHGGLQTVRFVSDALLSLGARPAEGGEFTKRAFLNGKMDLTQAEAVMDLINAQAESSLRSALHQLGGGLGREIWQIEEMLLLARASIEAAIDYPDEVEESVCAALPQKLRAISKQLEEMIQKGRAGRILRDGIRVVILGRPNVGKSSLFNALLGENRAIVTQHAGTTRDILDERIVLDGVSVRLLDTAGLREATDEAESIGIDRAREALRYADLLLIVLDGSQPLMDEDRAILDETNGLNRILLANKSDLGTQIQSDFAISCVNGDGINQLKSRIVSMASPALQDMTCITNLRHVRALESAKDAIDSAICGQEWDCMATDLKEASHHLGTITGSDVDEALLDRIFENFCVGK